MTQHKAERIREPLTRDEVKRIVGGIEDSKIAAIIATGATKAELEEAAGWALGESDILGKLQRHASPRVAQLYEILSATVEETLPEDGD